MWTQNGGNVFWSDAAKLKLVGLLKRYPDAINGDRLNPKKHLAWKNIYDGLIKAGMPSTSVSRIKKCWSRIHLAAKAQHADQLKRFSNRGKLVPLSTLNQTIINLLNDVNSNIMPKVSLNNSILRSIFSTKLFIDSMLKSIIIFVIHSPR